METQNPYQPFVTAILSAVAQAKQVPLASAPPPARVRVSPDAPKVLIFSPHPDDEAIVGGLPLRLLRESGWNIINVAVTLGSKRERRQARLAELRCACDYLQFDLINADPNGMDDVTPTGRSNAASWQTKVDIIADIIRTHNPRAVLLHHTEEHNATHVGTHHLVMDALRSLPDFSCWGIATEFWGQIAKPNLMVEIPPALLADMIAALSYHVGEVERNPYHTTLAAWMMNSVRMGSETVGGQGGTAPEMPFATLYGFAPLRGGIQKEDTTPNRRIISASDCLADLFPAL